MTRNGVASVLIIIVIASAASPAAARPACGPPIEAVVAAVLKRAGLDRKQERSWRRRLALSAVLPRLSSRAGQSRESGEFFEPRVAELTKLNNYLAFQWDVRATWDLSRLIFDSRELRVAARARQNASQRQQLLEQVVRLYFERCRLLLSGGMAPGKGEEGLRQALEVQRLTALLDGLSGGLFTGAAWP